VSFALESAFKPYTQMPGTTSTAIDVEWNFFYGTFAGGYGACTTNSTPGAYDCPGGITVQLTQPVGNPYVVTAVELVDRTDWSAGDVTPFTAPNDRAASLVVSWTSVTPSNFADTLTEANFPADSIDLPSDADQAFAREVFFPEAAMFHGAAAFTASRQFFTQYTGSLFSFQAGSSGNNEPLANTGGTPGGIPLLAAALVLFGLLARINSARWALNKN
jgi:hypothetical protein